jgi:hypothetical protein
MNIVNVPKGNNRANAITWPSQRPGWTAAHEAGHLMGLRDMYDKKTGKPLVGWEKNIMGSRSGVGVVQEMNIDDIISSLNSDNTIRTNYAESKTESTNEPLDTRQNPGKKNK